MRYTAGRLNRAWLIITGSVLLLGGGLAVATGLGVLEGRSLAGLRSPGPEQPVLVPPAGDQVLAGVLLAAGLVLGVLAVLWLLAQVPRKHGASTVKLEDPDSKGLTLVEPVLLEDAMSARLEELDDVTGARTVLRGSSRTPDITVRATTTCRAAIPYVVADIEQRITHDLRVSLGQEPASLAIEIDVRATPKKQSSVTVDAVALDA